jgi:predicted membrane chloride channel (bestrophin family)
MAQTLTLGRSIRNLLGTDGSGITDERKSGRVAYDVEDHCLIFQMYGSVWGKVLPYCLFNVVLTYVITALKVHGICNLTCSDKGHTYMATMVAFLVVTRCNVSYNRWKTSRKLLTDMMEACRALIQHAVTFTRNEMKPSAVKWRAEIARRTVTVLRSIVTVVIASSDHRSRTWEVAELDADEKNVLLFSVGGSNERSPLVLITFLRTAIAAHVDNIDTPLDVNQELLLFTFAKNLFTAYHNFSKLSMVPFPFPLLQMSRTFLFVWTFTLPFALASDINSLPAILLMIFAITYGVLGLETASIEMDDPFGDDPCDFDVMSFAHVIFEDIYIAVRDLDGSKAAQHLKHTVENPVKAGCFKASKIIQSELLAQNAACTNKFSETEKIVLDLNSGRVLNKYASKKAIDFKLSPKVEEAFQESV